MANAYDAEADAGGGPSPGPSGAAGGQGGGGPPGPPPDGSGVMAALAKRFQGPQVSAPGAGDAASGMNDLLQAVRLIQSASMRLPPGPLLKDATDSIKRLIRHLPQGSPTEGVQKTSLMDQVRQLLQNVFRGRVMQQMQGQAGGGQDQAAGPDPSMAQAPAPTTPLPGA